MSSAVHNQANSFDKYLQPQRVGYDQIVSVYNNHVSGNHNIYKSMAMIQAELDKLTHKAQSHNSESLQKIIKKKEDMLAYLKQFSELSRDTHYSRGKVAQDQVNAYMELFA